MQLPVDNFLSFTVEATSNLKWVWLLKINQCVELLLSVSGCVKSGCCMKHHTQCVKVGRSAVVARGPTLHEGCIEAQAGMGSLVSKEEKSKHCLECIMGTLSFPFLYLVGNHPVR